MRCLYCQFQALSKHIPGMEPPAIEMYVVQLAGPSASCAEDVEVSFILSIILRQIMHSSNSFLCAPAGNFMMPR